MKPRVRLGPSRPAPSCLVLLLPVQRAIVPHELEDSPGHARTDRSQCGGHASRPISSARFFVFFPYPSNVALCTRGFHPPPTTSPF